MCGGGGGGEGGDACSLFCGGALLYFLVCDRI